MCSFNSVIQLGSCHCSAAVRDLVASGPTKLSSFGGHVHPTSSGARAFIYTPLHAPSLPSISLPRVVALVARSQEQWGAALNLPLSSFSLSSSSPPQRQLLLLVSCGHQDKVKKPAHHPPVITTDEALLICSFPLGSHVLSCSGEQNLWSWTGFKDWSMQKDRRKRMLGMLVQFLFSLALLSSRSTLIW